MLDTQGRLLLVYVSVTQNCSLRKEKQLRYDLGVYDMELRDLPPDKDPKGGSPRTPPGGIRRSELPPPFETPNITYSDSNGGFSKFTGIIISILCTALIGMTVAWWTALQERGINRKDMEEYVRTYSPYVLDKKGIEEHQQRQDGEIGRISGTQQEVLRRVEKLESTQRENP